LHEVLRVAFSVEKTAFEKRPQVRGQVLQQHAPSLRVTIQAIEHQGFEL